MNGGERQILPKPAVSNAGPVISNAGPLITLATIGRLDLLKALFGQIIIAQAVHDEVVVHGEGEPGSEEVDEASWITTAQVADRLAVDLLRETLDVGESEAIVLAQEVKARYLLLDDGLAAEKRGS